jgi:hypothetical protein
MDPASPRRAGLLESRRNGAPLCQGGTFHAVGAATKNVKGALGQALVQKYFEYAGWATAPTGIESVVDHLMHQQDTKRGDLRNLPDLIISKVAGSLGSTLSHPLGQAFYVEVKTWAKWPEQGRNLEAYTKFGTVLVVWVSPEGLRGTWLSKPPTPEGSRPRVAKDPQCVLESDFTKLELVGSVAIQHCPDSSCQRRLREEFDTEAKILAGSRSV